MVRERPLEFNFSKNDIRYVFQLSDLERSGLYLQVKLLYQNIGETEWNELQTFDLVPDAAGFVYLYVQQHLDSLLQYKMPYFVQAVSAADEQAKKFVIQFREIEDANLDPEWDTTEETNYTIPVVIKGGLEKMRYKRDIFFGWWWQQNTPFLTWQPYGRFVFDDQPCYLTFLNKNYSTEGLKITLTLTDTSGVTETHDETFILPTGYLHIINLNYLRSSITSSLTDPLYWFELKITDAEDEIVAASYRFYIEKRPLYRYWDLFFHNSLGGFDSVRIRGEVEEGFERSYDEGEGGFSVRDGDYPGDELKVHATTQIGLNLRRSYKGDIGWMRTRKEQEAMMELLVSSSVWQLYQVGMFKYWIPVLMTNRSQSLGLTTDKKRSFPVEWTLSESNEVFTPIDAPLRP